MLINNDILEFPMPVTNSLMAERIRRGHAVAASKPQAVKLESDQALSLTHSSDGRTLVSAGFDGVIHLWDMAEAKELAKLTGEMSAIRCVRFSPNGRTLASVSDDGLIRLWEISTRTLKMTSPGLSEAMRKAARFVSLDAVAFAPDGRSLAVAGGAGINPDVPEAIYEVRVIDVQTGKSMWAHMGRGDRSLSLAYSPDGKILACAGGSAVQLWNARTGEPVRTVSPTRGGIFAVAFTLDAKSIIGGGSLGNHSAGQVTLWDVATGTIRQFFASEAGIVQSVAVAPDGKTIASGGDGPWRPFPNENRRVSSVSLRDSTTGKLLWAVDGELGTVRSLAFAPDGKTLSYCDDRVIGVIDVATGKTVRFLVRSNLKPLE